MLVFFGSVFLTSEKFVNEENTVKFYFTVFSFLLILLYPAHIKNEKRRKVLRGITSFKILKGFYLVGVLQSLFGLCQYIGWFITNNHFFNVTGSFENPAGFSAVLSLLFPIGLIWSLESKKLEKYALLISLGFILFSIIISGSRTGLLAVTISTIFIFTLEFHLTLKILNGIKYLLLSSLFFCSLQLWVYTK